MYGNFAHSFFKNSTLVRSIKWGGVVLMLALVLAGCTLPWRGQDAEGTPADSGSPPDSESPDEEFPPNPVGPLPPALVEASPLPGSEIPVGGGITLYFNQPMDKSSVEGALLGSPALNGSFVWLDDATLEFSPAQPFPADIPVTLSLAVTAKSAEGLAMDAPQEIGYQTADYLRLSQALPVEDTFEISPESAIVAAFNQPVVALGADAGDLPAAFSLEPAAAGRGEWLNTSTYIFHPAPALTGGQEYRVNINPDLESTDGTPLETSGSWIFTTLQPGYEDYTPARDALHVRLDAPVVVTFNQGMDTQSVEAGFSLVDEEGEPVAGDFSWSEDLKEMTFTPDQLLDRGERYTFSIASGVNSLGGTPVTEGISRSFYAAMELFVLNTVPARDGVKETFSPVEIQFNAPIGSEDPLAHITITPEVKVRAQWNEDTLWLFGNFEAEQGYTVTVDGDIEDIWGGQMGFDYPFTFSSAPLSARFAPAVYQGRGALFVSAEEPQISAQVVNLDQVVVQTGNVSLEEFIYHQTEALYDETQNLVPGNLVRHTVPLDISPNRNQIVGIPLNGGDSLAPGLYWFAMDPLPAPDYSQTTVDFAVVSHVQLVFKASATEALVWAIDRRTNNPVAGVTVRIVDAQGEVIANGQTDQTGLYQSEFSTPRENFSTLFAILSSPGNEFFSLAKSDWNEGLSAWDFGYSSSFLPPHTNYYIYTDRPVYRPGQTVEFRLIAREKYNGRYEMPEPSQVEVLIRNYSYEEIGRQTLTLTEFGTAAGRYTLPEASSPGYYEISVEEAYYYGGRTFQVAEYRKPEIDLSVSATQPEITAGEQISAEVAANYFFDAPAAGTALEWNVYVRDSRFFLPGYQVGPADLFFARTFGMGESELGAWIAGGREDADADGRLAFTTPSTESNRTRIYTIETTVRDDSGFPVSNRDAVTAHPAQVYFGLKSNTWLGQVDTEMMFDVLAVDWNQQLAGIQDLTVSFGEVTWEQGPVSQTGFPTYEKQVEVLTEGSFQTNAEGKIRLPFTPASPGIYQLEVRSGNALSQLIFWVGGAGSPVWPQFDAAQLELVADKERYQPGEIASVFVPNPFLGPALALVTTERGKIMDHQILQVSGSGMSLPVSLDVDSAPNIYLTVTLLGPEDFGELGYRYGLVNLPVDASAQLLNVEVLGEPQTTTPGETVEFTIRVADGSGAPVQGEFSLSVVDKAVLALSDPYEPPITDAYYRQQSIGVQTGISLAADAELYLEIPGGLGGGGGGDFAPAPLRSEFKDTAYWNATVVTGSDGTATVKAALPDNLTTWRVQVRGLTKDTLVGEAVSEVVTTKPLLVRPVLPRFAVVGDRLELAALVHNNTGDSLEVSLALKVSGVTLEDPAAALQNIEVPANGRVRVGWWGVVDNTDEIDMMVAADGGGLSDATQPESGGIPVLRYLAPQAFSTAGVLDSGGERLELVSLPRSIDVSGGGLRLELASSLGGVALEGLKAIQGQRWESTEYTVSRFLPNLEVFRVIQEFGLDEQDLQAELEADLTAGLEKLEAEQNLDGGWGWYRKGATQSNPVISAYVLLGLTRAQEAGYSVSEWVVDSATGYLTGYLVDNPPNSERPWEYDRAAFIHFALSEADAPVVDLADRLLDSRSQMNPWSQALLGLALREWMDSDRVDTLFSDLQGSAVRSATGAHWEERESYWQNMTSDTFNNAVVIYALAQQDPASPLISDAVRYLMAYRDSTGGWRSSYATSWALLALTEVMRGTAELGGEFSFSASLNDNPFAVGEAGGVQQFSPVVAETGLESLLPTMPNALTISREPGTGRLYYRATLDIVQPAESVEPINRGIGVSRVFYSAEMDCVQEDCPPIAAARVGDLVTVRVTLNLPNSVHFVQVIDHIPAGTEVLDLSLKTSQLGEAQQGVSYDPGDPLAQGWGWWYFSDPQVYDDRIAWLAEYLPAGTYELTYTLVVLQLGRFQVIPADAHQVYFPEVQGVSAGSVFEVTH
jgi:hypothetical protein